MFQVCSWGGYTFIINLIPIHMLACLLAGKYSAHLYIAYAPFVSCSLSARLFTGAMYHQHSLGPLFANLSFEDLGEASTEIVLARGPTCYCFSSRLLSAKLDVDGRASPCRGEVM
jgi:hypothetical protein